MKNNSVKRLVVIALIAAMYTALTLALGAFSFGSVQMRVGEALTLLPVYSPVAIWGVTLGCALSNIVGVFTGTNILGILDVVFGTIATFLAAICSYQLRNIRFFGLPVLSSLPPVLLNALIIGGELTFLIAGGFELKIFLIQALSVGLGQVLSCCILGLLMVSALDRTGVSGRLFREVNLGSIH